MSASSTKADAARLASEVSGLMEDLTGASDDVGFDEPWQLNALALAVAARKSGL